MDKSPRPCRWIQMAQQPGNPFPLLHGDQCLHDRPPCHSRWLRGWRRTGWAAAAGGPETLHRVQPPQGRGPEPSRGLLPGLQPLHRRPWSPLIHVSEPGLSTPSVWGRSAALPAGGVTAPVHGHRGAKGASRAFLRVMTLTTPAVTHPFLRIRVRGPASPLPFSFICVHKDFLKQT